MDYGANITQTLMEVIVHNQKDLVLVLITEEIQAIGVILLYSILFAFEIWVDVVALNEIVVDYCLRITYG